MLSQRIIQKKFRDYFQEFTSFGNPLVLLLVALLYFGAQPILIIITIGLIANDLIGGIIKYFFYQSRPKKQNYHTALEKIDAGSFPSLHTGRATFVLGTILKATPDLLLSVTLVAVLVIVGYSRVFLKKHRWIDVLAGYGLGVGLLFFLSALF